jgi:hypothetical protein
VTGMRATSTIVLLLCACGQTSDATDPVVAGTQHGQPASVVSYLGATADTGPIAQVWISDQTGYCTQVATMDPCHANFSAGEGPLAGTYLRLSARGTTPGTYAVPTEASAQAVTVTGAFRVDRLSAASGSVTFSTLDAQGASGAYDVTFPTGKSAVGRFQATQCADFEPLYAKMRLPENRVSVSNTTAGDRCSSTVTCNSRTRGVSCTLLGGTSWTCQCTKDDGTTSSCSVASSGAACAVVPDSCCVVGF